MVTKIEKHEIMTLQEMMDTYPDKWFMFITVDGSDLTNPFNTTGYVIYTADREKELYSIEGTGIASIYSGLESYSPIRMGGMDWDD